MINPRLQSPYLNTRACSGCQPCQGCPPCQLPPIQLCQPVSNPPPETRVEYIPYQRTVIEYQEVERIEKVPREVVTTEYQIVKRKGCRPVERLVQDFYTVEYVTEYKPEIISQKRTDMIPREVIRQSVQYVPYERQIVHYPAEAVRSNAALGQEFTPVNFQGRSGFGPAVVQNSANSVFPANYQIKTHQPQAAVYQSKPINEVSPSFQPSLLYDEDRKGMTGLRTGTSFFQQSPIIRKSRTATYKV